MNSATNTPIIILTIDSLRWDDVGCFGESELSFDLTPRINEVADDGVRYDAAISNGPSTLYSFLATFTSTYPLEYKQNSTENRPILTEELTNAGYQAAGFHSNPFLSQHYGFNRGFDCYRDFTGNSDENYDTTDTKRIILGKIKRALRRSPLLYEFAKEIKNYWTPPYTRAGSINNEVIRYIDDYDGINPLFLWTHYMDTHHPYLPEPKYQDLPFVPDISKWQMIRLAAKIDLIKREDYLIENISDNAIRNLRALYRAQVNRVDDAVGRVMDALKKNDLYDDALIIIMSDHGDEFIEHGMLGHSPSLYDELIHVPLIIKPPADEDTHVEVITGLTSYQDIAPTVLDFAGLRPPEKMQGKSVRSSLQTGETNRDKVISEYLHTGKRITSLRSERWKYILDDYHDREELYDLNADPEEQDDVRREHVDHVQDMRDMVQAHIEREKFAEDNTYTNLDKNMREQLESLGYM
jgi:arylsulfatase A-like enzyme